MIFELQASCGDLTGREQLTVKVDYDQNKTFVYSMEVQKQCVVVKFNYFFSFCYALNTSEVIVFYFIKKIF